MKNIKETDNYVFCRIDKKNSSTWGILTHSSSSGSEDGYRNSTTSRRIKDTGISTKISSNEDILVELDKKISIDNFKLSGNFLDFLNIIGAYEKYLKNINPENLKNLIVDQKEHPEFDIKDIVDYSFKWDSTNEGFEFWNNIDEQWNDLIAQKYYGYKGDKYIIEM
jgi:hypothetical protein